MSRALTDAEIKVFRDKLCAAATRRFAELGYDGVTMRGLATEIGCSPMTPYRYFDSKEEIFASVRAAAFKRLADICEAAASSAPNDLARAGAIGQAYLQFALSEPDAYKIMFELSQPDDSGFPELTEQVERSRRFMSQPTEIMVREGVLAGDPQKLSQMFWAGIHGVIVLHMTGKFEAGTDVEELFSMITATLMRGAHGPRFHEVEQALLQQSDAA
ncbi:MAG: TetR/AcrR family transcriptional regulator [Proteobacteria bacterium]|nr:TetR/AcrR family transcriptional regulator [Pseudomonadota bacterium]